jgi:hypothetical protein
VRNPVDDYAQRARRAASSDPIVPTLIKIRSGEPLDLEADDPLERMLARYWDWDRDPNYGPFSPSVDLMTQRFVSYWKEKLEEALSAAEIQASPQIIPIIRDLRRDSASDGGRPYRSSRPVHLVVMGGVRKHLEANRSSFSGSLVRFRPHLVEGTSGPAVYFNVSGRSHFTEGTMTELDQFVLDHMLERFAPRFATVYSQNHYGEFYVFSYDLHRELEFTLAHYPRLIEEVTGKRPLPKRNPVDETSRRAGRGDDLPRLLANKLRTGQLLPEAVSLAAHFSPLVDAAARELGIEPYQFERDPHTATGPGGAAITPEAWQHAMAFRGWIITHNSGTSGGEVWRIEPTGIWYSQDEEDHYEWTPYHLAREYRKETRQLGFDLRENMAELKAMGGRDPDAVMADRFLKAGGKFTDAYSAEAGIVQDYVAWWQVRVDAFRGDLLAARVLAFLRQTYVDTEIRSRLGIGYDAGWRGLVVSSSERAEYLYCLINPRVLTTNGYADIGGGRVGGGATVASFHDWVEGAQAEREAQLAAVLIGEHPGFSPSELL